MKLNILFFISLFCLSTQVFSQLFPHDEEFTRQDTLRGSVTPERAWWDLKHYELEVEVFPEKKMIGGKNIMTYEVTGNTENMQIDLQPPMELYKAVQAGEELPVIHEGNAHFIEFPTDLEIGKEYKITFYFGGVPKEAENAPWDGGITWTKDGNGLPFIASANQGIGASVWWPNKDHPYDEPDNGILMKVTVPENLVDVSNGRLIKTEHHKDKNTKTYHWQVINPINNYGVNINVGDYLHFGEKYEGENGVLDMDYYVLRENLEKAKEHFVDAKRTIEALEYWFGPYPFYEDSYKLVEVPYLGMEHQSSVTYGNAYKKGYKGRDLSGSGWGLKFDFIIIHESGHEWFANNITNKDVADMWIHESFTAYSESLFLEYHYGKEAAAEYVIGTRMNIMNDRPIIGIYNLNYEGSGDMYYKGANMLHTIRQVINDDEKWREILRGLNADFFHKTVNSSEIESYISKKAGIDLSWVFDQYLNDVRIPVFSYAVKGNDLLYRWNNVIPGFNMPVKIYLNDQELWLEPTLEWKKVEISDSNPEIVLDSNFYVAVMNVLGK